MLCTDVKNKNPTITIHFEFISIKKMIKISVNNRSTLKALRPLLANRFAADFAHIKLRFKSKGKNKEILDTEVALYEIPYFKTNSEVCSVEV